MPVSTTATSLDDIAGYEHDWLACDADDHVALFTTAGAGWVPVEFLRDIDAHAAALDALLALAASTTARFAPRYDADVVNTWKLVAERGLFAYDCEPTGGPYRQVAAPVAAVRVDALPAPVAAQVRAIRLPLHFTAQPVIGPDPPAGMRSPSTQDRTG